MPELPEVENTLRGLSPLVEGKTILDVIFSPAIITSHQEQRQAIVKDMSLEDFSQQIQCFTIKKVTRRGKYLLFSNGAQTMINHLGMTGTWFVVDKVEDIPVLNYRKHWHVKFHLDSGEYLIFSDIRRFGELRYTHDIDNFQPILVMAPEPFEETALPHFLSIISQKKYRNRAIKPLIMSNDIVTGCGNIYACEALFLSHINPHQKVRYLTETQLINLFNHIRLVLQQGIDNGGTTISDYRDIYGSLGSNQHQLHVYGKEICPICHQPLAHDKIGGRMSHYCAHCQPLLEGN